MKNLIITTLLFSLFLGSLVSAIAQGPGFRIQTCSVEYDWDGDGVIDEIENHYSTSYQVTYDANGNILSWLQVTSEDYDQDGIIDYTSSEYYTFHPNGNIASLINEYEYNGEFYRYTETYNSDGKLLTAIGEYDENGDGSFIITQSQTNTYDAEGNVLTKRNEYDASGDDVLDLIQFESYTYDANGNLLSRLKEHDDDGDGVINLRQTTVNTYDANSNQLSYLYESDYNGDGTVDQRDIRVFTYHPNGQIESRLSESDRNADGIPNKRSYDTFDDAGNVLISESGQDRNYDGIIDDISIWTYIYDSYRNITQSFFERDTNADGVIDQTRYLSNYSNNYDASGLLTSTVWERRSYANSPIELRYTSTFTYDVNGNMLLRLFEQDSNADGSINRITAESFTYDSNGNQLTRIVDQDNDADGNIDSRRSYSYDSHGNLLSEIYERDNDDDGTFDSISREIYTYDSDNNRVSYIEEKDYNYDGNIDYRNTLIYLPEGGYSYSNERDVNNDGVMDILYSGTYDENDNFLNESSQSDYDGDGQIDYLDNSYNTYDEFGNLQSSVYQIDYNGDGIFDEIGTALYCFETIQPTQTPEEMIEDLESMISALENLGSLNHGNANALLNKLENILKKLDEGKIDVACTMLQSFVQQVGNFINNGTLTEEEGNPILAVANAARIEIGCSTQEPRSIASFDDTKLYQNFPNPAFNQSETTISFFLPMESKVRLKVFDPYGRLISVLADEKLSEGEHSYSFPIDVEKSGMYFYRLEASDFQASKTMMILNE